LTAQEEEQPATKEAEEVSEKNPSKTVRLVQWFDSRLGLSYSLLRPVPQYAVNPFYWLGALAVVAFVIQGITGLIMMLYYIPSPTQAYATTQYIFQNVSYGRFLQTVHLYTAYAMIMLAFMHMMRGYFVSAQKKPREVMWIVGMLMGFVTLGFGFTGYLLPWTVVSKSATDVGIGMINALPPPVASLLSFLIVGAGGDATELLRFYDLHVVVLPAVLLVLLAVKMYMLESHGISEPVTGGQMTEKAGKPIPIFPDVSLYLLELAAIFGAGMLLISALFPLNLPAEYTPALAGQTVSQPDWYFLWIYQILKISVFEQSGPLGTAALTVALSFVTLIFIILILLPFLDRRKEKRIRNRPIYVTLGAIFVAEIVTLAYWGLVTPGQIIPAEIAALVLGGIALLVAAGSLVLYKLLSIRTKKDLPVVNKTSSLRTTEIFSGLAFTFVAASGALGLGGAFDAVTKIIMNGVSLGLLEYLGLSVGGLVVVVLATMYLIYRSDLRTGSIRRRIRAFEIGWASHNEMKKVDAE
jgi:quinol-cytochrome oxidoreductase complex cytochrome b subunit